MRRGSTPPQVMGLMTRPEPPPPPGCKPTGHRWRWDHGDEWYCRRCDQTRHYGEIHKPIASLPSKNRG
jgi:hypothetical protein